MTNFTRYLIAGNVKQAINCYAKASKFHPRDISLRLRRIELLESIGEDKLAFRCTFGMLAVIPPEEGAFLLERAKYVAKKFVEENKLRKALCALNCAYAKIPDLFKLEDIHMYLELLTSNGSYKVNKCTRICSNVNQTFPFPGGPRRSMCPCWSEHCDQ